MKKLVVFGLFLLVLLMLTAVVYADGTETLGDPSIAISSGTGVVAAGVGLQDSQPGTININVPGDVVQVLAYWAGGVTSNIPSDDTIVIDGNEVTGTLIGGPAYFFDFNAKSFYDSNYRADITNLGLVSTGANSLSVEGLDNKDGDGDGGNSGVGLLVIYDDGSLAADIVLKDGLDLAYAGFPEPRQTTVPQTFPLTPSASERTATLVIFASSVGENRPNTIALSSDAGDIPDVEDVLASVDGDLWDTITLPFTVPANATEVTVEIVSGSSSAGDPASLNWIGAGLAVSPPLGCIGDMVWHDDTTPFCDATDNQTCQNEDQTTNGLNGVRVRLFRQIGSDTFEQVGEMETQTNPDDGRNGWYEFCELPAGNYLVDVNEEDITDLHFPNGWILTSKNDPYPRQTAAPGTETINLGTGEFYEEADFGYNDLGDLVGLGDYVWWDKEPDGILDPSAGELPIPCVTVWLFDADGNQIGQTNTDSWGFYGYFGLPTTALPDGYTTAPDLNDPDIDNFIDFQNGQPVTPTCNLVPAIFPSSTSTTLMQPMAKITTDPTATMQDSNIGGTIDLTLDFAFWRNPTAISLASFEVTEAASSPATWIMAAAVLGLLATGAWLLRRRQTAN